MLRPVVMSDRFVFVCYFEFIRRELNSMYLCANSTCTCLKCFVQVLDAVCQPLVLIHDLAVFF